MTGQGGYSVRKYALKLIKKRKVSMQYNLFQPIEVQAPVKQEAKPVAVQAEIKPEFQSKEKTKNRVEDSQYGRELAEFNARYTRTVTDELFRHRNQ